MASWYSQLQEAPFYLLLAGCFFVGLAAGLLFYLYRRRQQLKGLAEFNRAVAETLVNTEVDINDEPSDISSSTNDDKEESQIEVEVKEIKMVSPEEIDQMEEEDIPPPLLQEDLEKSLEAEMDSGLINSMSLLLKMSLNGTHPTDFGEDDEDLSFFEDHASDEDQEDQEDDEKNETVVDIKSDISKTKVVPQPSNKSEPKDETDAETAVKSLPATVVEEAIEIVGGKDLWKKLTWIQRWGLAVKSEPKNETDAETAVKSLATTVVEEATKKAGGKDLWKKLTWIQRWGLAVKAKQPATASAPGSASEPEPELELELEPQPVLTEEELLAADEKLVKEEYKPPTDPNDAWEAVQDEDGDTYFYNTVTEESTWEQPPGFKPKQGQAKTTKQPDESKQETAASVKEEKEQSGGESQRELYIRERKRLQAERKAMQQKRKSVRQKESLMEQMHKMKHLVKGREAKKLVKKLEKQEARQMRLQEARNKIKINKAGSVDKNSLAFQIEKARDIENTKKKMDSHYKSIEDKQKQLQEQSDKQHDRLYDRLQQRGSIQKAPSRGPKELEDRLFDRSLEEEGLENDLKMFSKEATKQKAKKGGLGFGLKVGNARKDAITRSLHRHEQKGCEDLKAALKIYCIGPRDKLTKKEKKAGKTEGALGHPLHNPMFGLQRAMVKQGFKNLPPPMLKTVIQISCGEDLNASRLSTLIIEIHKMADEAYRGTPVCRWEDFLHWIGVKSYSEIKNEMPKPTKGKPKGNKGKIVYGSYTEPVKKKKKKRRKK